MGKAKSKAVAQPTKEEQEYIDCLRELDGVLNKYKYKIVPYFLPRIRLEKLADEEKE